MLHSIQSKPCSFNKNGKQCDSWSGALSEATWSGSAVFAEKNKTALVGKLLTAQQQPQESHN